MLHPGNADFAQSFGRSWRPLTIEETLKEELAMLEHIMCDACEFRSNHASNWLALKGRLQRGRKKLIDLIREVLADPDSDMLRPDWMRAL